jgi:hypothetical protein
MGTLTPHLSVLPESQRQLWNRLGPTPNQFVLYGGTALALRLEHRISVDFDFFACRPFFPLELVREVPYLADQRITQEGEGTLTCEIRTGSGDVKVSFFGGLTLRQIDAPDLVESNGIAVASVRDLFGMKCATVPQRSEAKDYLDIHALIHRGRIDLSEGIACAAAIYGRQYNPVMTLQALSYFEDLREPVSQKIKADLRAAVAAVSLRELPLVEASQRIGDGVERSG